MLLSMYCYELNYIYKKDYGTSFFTWVRESGSDADSESLKIPAASAAGPMFSRRVPPVFRRDALDQRRV
jgi:hypothetical protein